MQVLERIDIGQDPPGIGIVLQVIQHPVHLVKHPLCILVLDTQLVTVGLSDGTVRPCPFVPDMTAQVGNPVGFLLPNPQQLIHRGFPVGSAQGHNGKFLRQIVPVHHAEFLDGMGRRSVRPVGAHRKTFIRKAVFQNVPAGCLVKFVRSAHISCLLLFISDILSYTDGFFQRIVQNFF